MLSFGKVPRKIERYSNKMDILKKILVNAELTNDPSYELELNSASENPAEIINFVIETLEKASCISFGKTNMDEFAMGSSNETSWYGPVINPWQDNTVPGGSSGGSAAAVAARLAVAATGTDTGGSIRQPASLCGITGLKPTYGRVSRYGMIAFASSLDQAGPMTKSVRDAAIMLEAMCGHDPKDSTSADLPVPNFEAMLTGDIKGKKIGIPREYRMDGMPTEIESLWTQGAEMLRDAGASYVIVGHSERRTDHGETDGMVRAKARAALDAKLIPIICVGETDKEREAGVAVTVVEQQLQGSTPDLDKNETIVIAYEPVWAIGTGLVPTETDIAEMHAAIRTWLHEHIGAAGLRTSILYGGSMKRDNAAAILTVENVDGGLVGGASLKVEDFLAIIRAA